MTMFDKKNLVQRLREVETPASDPGLPDEAADEIERLQQRLEAVEAWQNKGATLLQALPSLSVLFSLGQWWADRPWRSRD